MTRTGGIIAAGDGSRLKLGGYAGHKPLLPIGGVPLIGRTLQNFADAGFEKVVIIFNESENDCVEWVKEHSPVETDVIVKTTKSSFESFWRVGSKLGAGRHVITTVDSLCPAGELKKMAEAEAPSDEGIPPVFLGLTDFVEDEKPLWVRMNGSTKRIEELGGGSGNFVTAGFYGVPGAVFERTPPEDFSSLRKFLGWLVKAGFPVYGVPLSKVVDVDRPEDVKAAEEFVRSGF